MGKGTNAAILKEPAFKLLSSARWQQTAVLTTKGQTGKDYSPGQKVPETMDASIERENIGHCSTLRHAGNESK